MPGRRLRISLRLFLLLMLLSAAAMGWFATAYLQPYREEAAARKRLVALGATVNCIHREPHWLWQIFGEHIAEETSILSLVMSNPLIGDAELEPVSKLKSLQAIYLDGTKVTDAGIQKLGDLVELRGLNLRRVAISHPPTRHLSKLISLDLAYTAVAKLDTSSMTKLELLDLRGTRINDETLTSFASMPELRTLDISGDVERHMNITDHGVSHLTREKFPKLTRIFLYHTEVTNAALQSLTERFPGAGIYHNASAASSMMSPPELSLPGR
jgi:hypothetical protein